MSAAAMRASRTSTSIRSIRATPFGYDSWISVEHEDRRFEGGEELVKRGFLLARTVLRPLIV